MSRDCGGCLEPIEPGEACWTNGVVSVHNEFDCKKRFLIEEIDNRNEDIDSILTFLGYYMEVVE